MKKDFNKTPDDEIRKEIDMLMNKYRDLTIKGIVEGKLREDLMDLYVNHFIRAGQKSSHYLGIPVQKDKDTTMKADKMEWIDIGWNEIQFKIPRGYNHQLVKEFEQAQQSATQKILCENDKFILDACCGGRMMWFNKHHPNTIYIDNRVAEKGHIKEQINHEVRPDFIMDFRNTSFKDKEFKLIVFDPPHLTNLAETSIMRKKFGVLNKETWQEDIRSAFKELWRVLEDYGVLIIKWNDIQIPYKKMLSLFEENPLFMNITAGQKALKTKNRSYWFCFMKIPTLKSRLADNHNQ